MGTCIFSPQILNALFMSFSIYARLAYKLFIVILHPVYELQRVYAKVGL